ncbi:DUF484 family protein [Janthinobacterium fluminis]|uniref:DUF484 family protein n=1 Tax=Janthinobacterium fluminis TaxID=2987524 RepID=A0ABT5K692_9BURK|nr:DUF484 family protein [Janthinobacterium fluminis]MDC8760444.1 DUF484 family protein [Janthinobacterium fluminis]
MTATLDSTTVAQYLTDHPQFFQEHVGLLGEVKLTSPLTGRTVSLQERQMEVMRDKYKALELRLSELSRLAEENAGIAAKFHGWTQDLLRAREAAGQPRAVVDGMLGHFAVPYATLRLWDLAPQHADAWFTAGVSDDARLFASSLQAPYCGANKDFEAVRWLDAAAPVASTAMLALRAPGGAAFGLLVLGAPDAARFKDSMATDFLVNIAATASTALALLRA